MPVWINQCEFVWICGYISEQLTEVKALKQNKQLIFMEIKGVLEEASKDSSSLYLPKPINIFSILTLICKSSKKPRGIAESNLRILRMLLFYFLPIQNAQHVTDIYLHYLCSKYSPHHSPRFCCCHHNVQAIVSSALS